MSASDLNGNKYARLAAEWGTDPDDAVIKLLEAFDRRFDELKTENAELRSQISQWTGITSQLLGLVRDQNQEAKTLSSNTKALSDSSQTLSQDLQNFKTTIDSQPKTFEPLQRDTQSLKSSVSALDTTLKTLPTATALTGSEKRLSEQIRTSGGKGDRFYFRIYWYTLGFASFLLFITFSAGQMHGERGARAEVAAQFGGASNLDYWKQMRDRNKDRVAACQSRNRAECPMKLP